MIARALDEPKIDVIDRSNPDRIPPKNADKNSQIDALRADKSVDAAAKQGEIDELNAQIADLEAQLDGTASSTGTVDVAALEAEREVFKAERDVLKAERDVVEADYDARSS